MTSGSIGGFANEVNKGDRDAMRAFLARSEVRISTMHRIGLGFINGAGLLVLFPIFFKDVIAVIIATYLTQVASLYPSLGSAGMILSVLVFTATLYPFLVAVGLPVYALYLLLKDILHFYFTIYSPGYPNTLNNPSFSLSGLAFSPDESETVKREVLRLQYETNLIDFAMPFSEKRKSEYFDQLIEATKGEIIPATRTPEQLALMGIHITPENQPAIQRLNAEFGLARTLDATLVEEVAKAEVLLARNVMYLRRLVFRYFKTLITFIWTTIISFVMMPFLQDGRFEPILVLAGGYLIWSVMVLYLIHLPFHWLYRFNHHLHEDAHLDSQILLLEKRIKPFVMVAIASALVALALEISLRLLGVS